MLQQNVKALHVLDGARSWPKTEIVQRKRTSLSALQQMKLKVRNEKTGGS